MTHENEHTHTNGAGYEVEDASIREILFTGLGLAVGTIIICFAVAGLYKVLTATDKIGTLPMTEIPTVQTFPPGPRLQEKPWEELRALRRREDSMLATYGWVNKDAGSVRLPIDRAMDVVIQRGLPSRPSAPGAGSAANSGAAAAKTNTEPANVPPQAVGYPPKAAQGKGNAVQK